MKKGVARNERRGGKKGQVELSFGMIFSIFLIIVFIAFAIYAIGKFLDIQKSAKTGQFVQNLQVDIDKMWKSSSGSQEVEYSLANSVSLACFQDFELPKKGPRQDIYDDLRLARSENENFLFYPVGSSGGILGVEIKNINLRQMTASENPYCIENENGIIKMIISKGAGEALVKIKR